MPTLAALDWASQSSSAYDALNAYLSEHEDEVVTIEILPPAIVPQDGLLMWDGPSLGIPKKTLMLAFVEARRRFFDNIGVGGPASEVCHEASRVMLLFDAEHLTAANFRKRRLNAAFRDDDHHRHARLLHQEFMFLDSILTSPLHRQSKSPTLWNHRAFLLDQFLPVEHRTGYQTGSNLRTFMASEHNAVMKAGEHHPRNYYAWQYARQLVTKMDRLLRDEKATDLASIYRDIFMECVKVQKHWCFRHPSDISGWSFLSFLLASVATDAERTCIIREVIAFAKRLHLHNDSLWIFVGSALATAANDEQRKSSLQILTELKEGNYQDGSGSKLNARISKMIDWIESYGSREPHNAHLRRASSFPSATTASSIRSTPT